jgi:hypothetical protein
VAALVPVGLRERYLLPEAVACLARHCLLSGTQVINLNPKP